MADAEALAVAEIDGVVALSDYLKANIKEDDKFPSFDGVIRIQPHGSSKKDLEIVGIQIKGHMAESATELQRDSQTFQVEVVDLENFLRHGGAMFFYVVSYGRERRAYYSSLLPVKLKRILKSANGQKTKAIDLMPAPTDTEELEELLINHSRDSRRQFSFWDANLPDADLTDIPPGVSYSAVYASVATSEYEAARHLLGKDIYIYKESEDCPIPVPTNTAIQISTMGKTVKRPVSVKGNLFFDEYVTLLAEDEDMIVLGCVTLKFPSQDSSSEFNFNVTLRGTFRERLHALRFAKAMVEKGGFEIDGNAITLTDEDAAERFADGDVGHACAFYEDIAAVLDALDDDGDFDIESITEADIKTISMLKRGLVEGQRIRLADIDYDKAVCSARFFGRHYLLFRETDEYGLSSIRDYVGFETALAIREDEDDPMPLMKYGIARPTEYLDVANLSIPTLANECKRVGYNAANCECATDVALTLLNRYDHEGGEEDFATAEELFEWLNAEDNPNRTIMDELNMLQAQRRSGSLTSDAKERLHAIIEDDSESIPSRRELTAACWAILGDTKKSQSAFRKLNKELRDRLESYPIVNLMRGTARIRGH